MDSLMLHVLKHLMSTLWSHTSRVILPLLQDKEEKKMNLFTMNLTSNWLSSQNPS